MRDARAFARLSLVFGILILLTGIYYEPWIYIWAAPGLNERLVSCGNRAIHPMISAIRSQGPRSGLPGVLAKLGEPARQALREAVAEERDPAKKARLTDALREAFGS